MQNTATTRKRPAPGTSPLPPTQTMPQQTYQYQQQPLDTTDFSNFDFSQPLPTNQQPYTDPNAFDADVLSYALNSSQPPAYGNNIAPVPSTELVRRTRNQQLAPQNHAQQEQWNGFGNVNPTMDDEDEQDLEQRAALAKKDAQAKRKQIPPFVQKLSSFLDSNNTDLIRWSDDGRSFIVLDEDEFARTLIPELFKHNNYASFVRQLNMYGFHKTVNITDGSLRQSEKARKGVKPPSMYSHPYFRKNRPDLLWLIQKPAGGKATKRKRDGNMKDPEDSDDERQYSPVPETGLPQLSAPPGTSQDLTQLPRNEFAAVRRELQGLQTQQKFISQMITQLKEQNDQFYRQATAFQALHDRHENSINAILTFLATFYNRSLDGHGAQNLVNMFTNAQQSQQQHGSVVEEYNESTPTPSNQMQRYVKRPPLLLPGPTTNNAQNLQPGSAETEPSSARASVTPPGDRNSISSAPQSAATPTMKSEPPTPNILNQVPENNDQMMNIINSANATSQGNSPSTAAPTLDTNSMVDKLIGNSGHPLTPQQRDNMVANIVGSSNYEQALTAYKDGIDTSQHSLDYLQRLQKKQDEKVQELNRRLQPLSPTGSIPGLHDYGNQDPFDSLAGAPGDFDPNAFVDFDFDGGGEGDYDFNAAFGNAGAGGDWNHFDNAEDIFGTSPATDNNVAVGGEGLAPNQDDAGRVESVSGSEATSPTGFEEPGTPSKRQRRQ